MSKGFQKNFKIGDEVIVIAGNNKGAEGKVLSFVNKQDVDKCRVIIEGVNLGDVNLKKTEENPNGGKAKKERSIHYSNIKLKKQSVKGE